jgi:predicted 3-demethylubiquinone-9 3-methyltransferase (glyoxalase superfamily)
MQKIIPHLWFNNQAEEAVNFYIDIFKNSKILKMSRYQEAGAEISGMKKDTIMTIHFTLDDYEFIALNGGPEFSFTPAISFFVDCNSVDELHIIWDRLTMDGLVMMELDRYPFSEKFGWVQDKYGVSWQINLSQNKKGITPFLMYVGDVYGKAEEAMRFYTQLFDSSGITEIEYQEQEKDNTENNISTNTVYRATFTLDGQEFMAVDSGFEHSFNFTEAVSLFVNCDTQKEVDLLWESLTKDGVEQPCGWLKDKYGVSWQIVPTALEEMLNNPDPSRSHNVMVELLKMRKIDIDRLQEAYNQ